MTLSKETATDIALTHREIETAMKLIEQVTEARERQADIPDVRDAFGRLQGGLKLGVPSGESAHTLFQVPWSMARPVLEAHIASCKARLDVLCEKARFELGVTADIGDGRISSDQAED